MQKITGSNFVQKETEILGRILFMSLENGRFDTANDERSNQSSFRTGFISEFCGAQWNAREPGTARYLVNRVENAVDEISRQNAAAAPTRRWEALLGIVTYCYALGVYSSDEIDQAIASNANADWIYAVAFRDARPSAALRNFRRANREAIIQCLTRVLGACDSYSEAKERVTLAIEADSNALDF